MSKFCYHLIPVVCGSQCRFWCSMPTCGNPLQYSCLENPTDGGAWWAAVHGVPKSRTRLSNFTFTFHFHALEKEMATHSSVLAWRIPGMGSWWAAVYGVAQSRTRLKRLSSSSRPTWDQRFISNKLLIPGDAWTCKVTELRVSTLTEHCNPGRFLKYYWVGPLQTRN